MSFAAPYAFTHTALSQNPPSNPAQWLSEEKVERRKYRWAVDEVNEFKVNKSGLMFHSGGQRGGNRYSINSS